MYSTIRTAVLTGLVGNIVEVEADIATGLAAFNIVGLPDASIRESKERVRAALGNSGYRFPLGRVTINLAPASLKKEGSQLDLAIALGILDAMGIIVAKPEEGTAFIGELSLDGRIMAVEGALPMVISLRELGMERIIIPMENREECSLVRGVSLIPVTTLTQLIQYLNGEKEIDPYEQDQRFDETSTYDIDFADIKGQHRLKRAMEIAAAGKHNLLMIGPPGSGKTMAAMRIATILPDLTFEEAIECTKIYSVSGELKNHGLIRKRPFRAPHHTCSAVSLIGGGRIPKPGEVSLAHHGVLFLDELPEFQKQTIEVLRQPLEDGVVTISRVNASLTYPANFILVSGMNPCPCGNFGDPTHECTCSLPQIRRYQNKVSRPFLDRIDLHVDVKPVKLDDLTKESEEESSVVIKQRVERAREIQRQRYEHEKIQTNGELKPKMMKKYIPLTEEMQQIIQMAFEKYQFSARSFHKVLKLTRTIADLDGVEQVQPKHLLEAIQFRSLDGEYWNS